MDDRADGGSKRIAFVRSKITSGTGAWGGQKQRKQSLNEQDRTTSKIKPAKIPKKAGERKKPRGKRDDEGRVAEG